MIRYVILVISIIFFLVAGSDKVMNFLWNSNIFIFPIIQGGDFKGCQLRKKCKKGKEKEDSISV